MFTTHLSNIARAHTCHRCRIYHTSSIRGPLIPSFAIFTYQSSDCVMKQIPSYVHKKYAQIQTGEYGRSGHACLLHRKASCAFRHNVHAADMKKIISSMPSVRGRANIRWKLDTLDKVTLYQRSLSTPSPSLPPFPLWAAFY